MEDKNTRVTRESTIGPRDELRGRTEEPALGEVRGRAEGEGEVGYAPARGPAVTTSPEPARSTRVSSAAPAGAGDRTRELRQGIEHTRGEMSETVNAIQERLRPGNIASNAAKSVREQVGSSARDVADSESVQYVRANPIPTAMIGIGLAGLAWFAFAGRDADDRPRSRSGKRHDRDGGDRTLDTPGAYGTSLYGDETWEQERTGMRSDVTSRVSEMAGDARRRAGQTTARARQRASRVQHQARRTWNENPLLIGAAAAVTGAIVGLAVPETEREHEWMGETRDNMIEGVQQTVREKVEDVQSAASKAVSEVQNAVTGGSESKSKASSGTDSKAAAPKESRPEPGATTQTSTPRTKNT